MARATKVAVVTGGNKGIGLEVVRGLCRKFDGDVILTARDEAKGHAAVERLVRESEVEPLFRQLDISNHGSIHRLSNFLLDTYGGLDILVNNAGVMYPMGRGEVEALSTQVRDTMRVNFWGCLDCCKVLFPHLRPGARVVNVTSMYCRSTLRECSPPLRAQLTDPHITMAQLEKLMTDFQSAVRAGVGQTLGDTEHPSLLHKVQTHLCTCRYYHLAHDPPGGPSSLTAPYRNGVDDPHNTRSASSSLLFVWKHPSKGSQDTISSPVVYYLSNQKPQGNLGNTSLVSYGLIHIHMTAIDNRTASSLID